MYSKQTLSAALLVFLILSLFGCTSNKDKAINPSPAPIDHYFDKENPMNNVSKQAYFDLLHTSAPGTDWKQIEQKNILNLYNKKREYKGGDDLPIEGKWIEKGSNNQPGDLRVTDYYVPENKIYALSTSGTLWSTNFDGTNWTPLNEDIVFTKNILAVIEEDDGGKSIVCAFGKNIYTSNDNGENWQKSFGINFPNNFGAPRRLIEIDDDVHSLYYLVLTWNGSYEYLLYYSDSHGKNWSLLETFPAASEDEIDIWSPLDSNELYLVDNNGTGIQTYRYDKKEREVLGYESVFRGNTKVMLSGSNASGSMVLYVNAGEYPNDPNNLGLMYESRDFGETWTELGPEPPDQMPGEFMADPWIADRLYWGGVKLMISEDNGETWIDQIEETGYWYNDRDYLFVDIMYMNPTYLEDGTPFILLSHHSGLHISYDNVVSTKFLANEGLNNGQIYDFATIPDPDGNAIVLGTQDKGALRTIDNYGEDNQDYITMYTGDYLQIILTEDSTRMWIEYPFGELSYYSYPKDQVVPINNYDILGSDKLIWTLPMKTHGDRTINEVWVGGGNINGGPGSYLINLMVSNDIYPTQIDYDFKANSKTGTGVISAIEHSSVNTDHLYVYTSDATFFFSKDAGATWQKSNNFFGPPETFLFSTCILASEKDENVVYIGGSGYNNSPVFVSNDGGLNFTSMRSGLPPTVVYDMVFNNDESLIFAGTDHAPYVYDFEKEEWFCLAGEETPVQTYTSIEYLNHGDDNDVVRFGTMGRGLWDFKIGTQDSTIVEGPDTTDMGIDTFYVEVPFDSTEIVIEDTTDMDTIISSINNPSLLETNIYPNPVKSNTAFTIETNLNDWNFILVNVSGKIIKTEQYKSNTATINTNGLNAGIYTVKIQDNDTRNVITKKIIVD